MINNSFVFSAALFAVVASVAPPISNAVAEDFVTGEMAVHVAVPGPESEAQLIEQLQARGFAGIKVTDVSPTFWDARPDYLHGFTSATDPAAQAAAVHQGWNGTAMKDGRVYNVYVDTAVPAYAKDSR